MATIQSGYNTQQGRLLTPSSTAAAPAGGTSRRRGDYADDTRPLAGSQGTKVDTHRNARSAVYALKEADKDNESVACLQLDREQIGWFTEAQVREFIQSLLATSDVSQFGLSCVFNAAYMAAMANGYPMDGVHMVPQGELLTSFHKFRYYLDNASEIESLYDRFDPEKIGFITRRQLKDRLDHDKRSKEGRYGKVSELHAAIFNDSTLNETLDFVLSESIANADGSYERREMLPALATWVMLSQKYSERGSPGEKPCCSLM